MSIKRDLFVGVFFALVLCLFAIGYVQMHGVVTNKLYQPVSLALSTLPMAMLRTNMRLLIGLFWSLLFTLVFGTLAAKHKTAERFILPFINFMESVPLIGFLTFSTAFFMSLAPHNIMGIEYAAIFGVFTSQVWNMTLSLHQSLKVVPKELLEVARVFQLNTWQTFWKIKLPFALPGLLWNTMISQSAAWFALVATEAIPYHSKMINLPGVGSYIQSAILQGNVNAMLYAVLAMVINIIIFDQFLFRPLLCWTDKFKYEQAVGQPAPNSWFYQCLIHSKLLPVINIVVACMHLLFPVFRCAHTGYK